MAERVTDFEAVYAVMYEPILGYALRRCASPEDAADVVAETFTVAWRRFEEIPSGDRARLWLYGVARHVLANHRRSEKRRRLHTTRLRDEIAEAPVDPTDTAAITQALAGLDERDREVICLVAWEGLNHSGLATVLGCSPGTARVRLHRARKRLARALRAAGVEHLAVTPAISERSSLA
ncbi:sigma-70 family RNA polymerase sigma factor [Actinomadura barringtoniae]|uniref:Sigma-70 family RNA polymerase sigma factor n=1 Tax=Actinomadura barringtoniae TaxID=1427535 RepID=A0A939P882_9ACTN|nr:sigma-70 family RNA polymerase sigma factor [Actinomadura barringtoniae]MBO2447732.1 sigma-70 family RNA polymerase sigma factor [Actinomadura barringtoniae]